MVSYAERKYFAIVEDPVHVGIGRFRLGRVDMPIARDPSTNLPKVPGTTIEGTTRSYAAYLKADEGKGYIYCADKDKHKELCPKRNYECPICVSFGYTDSKLVPEEKPKSMRGMAQFSDARILFFPVYTMVGPVWVSSPTTLAEAELDTTAIKSPTTDSNILVSEYVESIIKDRLLNLGWILFGTEGRHAISEHTLININGSRRKKLSEIGISSEILRRLIICSDQILPELVNSNLEIRTSVAIDPYTGTAVSGALFDYEAIPRGTILYFNLVYMDPAKLDVGRSIQFNDVIKTVESGLSLFHVFGVGGMSTRGFGRIKILGLQEEKS